MNQPSETIGPIEKAARKALSLGEIMPPNNLISLEADYTNIYGIVDRAVKSATTRESQEQPENHARRTIKKCLEETRQVIKNLETMKQNRLAILKKQEKSARSENSQKISPEKKVNEIIEHLKYIQEIIREKICLEVESDPLKARYAKTTAEKALQTIENLRIIKAMIAISKKNRAQRLLTLERAAKKIAATKSPPPEKIYLAEKTPLEEDEKIIEVGRQRQSLDDIGEGKSDADENARKELDFNS